MKFWTVVPSSIYSLLRQFRVHSWDTPQDLF
ncbi:hypothetical protein POVCU1_025440, partial [Plasmodium ovale curtisi]